MLSALLVVSTAALPLAPLLPLPLPAPLPVLSAVGAVATATVGAESMISMSSADEAEPLPCRRRVPAACRSCRAR